MISGLHYIQIYLQVFKIINKTIKRHEIFKNIVLFITKSDKIL